MKSLKLFLILSGSLFFTPHAFADEIGSGQPEADQTTAAQPTPAENQFDFEALLNELFSWFE